jgi:hypothetical protein
MMTNNRSVLIISTITLILLALVPAVSANVVIYDRDLYEYIDTSKSSEVTWNVPSATGGQTKSIVFKDITKAQVLNYLVFEISANCGSWSNGTRIKEGVHNFTYNFNGADRPGVLYLNRKTNSAGKVTSTQFTIFLNDWDIGDLRGKQTINMPFAFLPHGYIATNNPKVYTDTNVYPYPLPSSGVPTIKVTESTGIVWKHHIKVEEDATTYYVYINGFIDGYRYTSQVNFKNNGELFSTYTNPGTEFRRAFLKTEINLVEIISPQGTECVFPLYKDATLVEFRPFDINGNVPLNGVQITVYTCDPVTFEPGDVVDIFTVDYGDMRYLPRGFYCIEASLNNYERVYAISETRFSNVDGPAIALIPLKREEVSEPNRPVEFRPFNINGNVPLNGVQITVYTCDPVTFEPGDVVDIFTVDYGDIKSLPRGYYCIEASLNNYEQVYSISETRFSNVDGPAVALIPMRGEEVIEPNQPVEFQPFDINANVPLNGVNITVYTCDPVTFEPGDVVDTFTVDYGEIKSLPRGYYCIEASLNNYEQVYSISETRFSNVDGPAVALIPMKREGVIEPNQPVEFRPFDTNGQIPLNGVQITVYTCDPVTFEPGDVVDIFTVDYGEIRSLPRGHYCIEASLNNYEQVYTISETRFSNVDGPAVALIPMKREYVGGEDGNVEVKIFDVDTEEPLQNVRLRIYEALPNFQQGRLVRDVTVSSGDYISLPAGRYFAQATKSGYTQYFEVTNTRVVVDPPSPAILYIPMTSRDGITPGEGSFLDQSIEAIANLFGVSFGIGKLILGMLLALGVGTATAKHLRGGAQEFGMGMLGGVVLGVLIGLLPIWVLVLLVLIVGLWVGKRYMDGGD